MLRKGRLYEMPVDEVESAQENTQQLAHDETKENVDINNESNSTERAASIESLEWITKRGKSLFEWMLNGISAEDFFAKYWEQEPLLIQGKQNPGTSIRAIRSHDY